MKPCTCFLHRFRGDKDISMVPDRMVDIVSSFCAHQAVLVVTWPLFSIRGAIGKVNYYISWELDEKSKTSRDGGWGEVVPEDYWKVGEGRRGGVG